MTDYKSKCLALRKEYKALSTKYEKLKANHDNLLVRFNKQCIKASNYYTIIAQFRDALKAIDHAN